MRIPDFWDLWFDQSIVNPSFAKLELFCIVLGIDQSRVFFSTSAYYSRIVPCARVLTDVVF
jgi:hypothetical protein